MTRRHAVTALFLVIAIMGSRELAAHWPPAASAQALEQTTQAGLGTPSGPVVLTVSGVIADTNRGETAVFDMAMLESLGTDEIVTETIWTPGTHRFEGVRLKTLLDRLAAEGAHIEARAINDYTVEIPASDATADGPILAYAMDGAPMSRRDKGPLWVIYPFSASPEFRTEVIYSRSIWQLDRLHIVE